MSKIQFDFESIKNRVLNKLSSMSEWASFLNYGTVDNIVSSIVNELAYEIQYSEYNSMENYWNLARNKSSLLQMSPMHGYIVPRKQASSGTVRISTSDTFDSSHSVDIQIPKFFQFSGNNIYVCSDSDNTLNANENYIDINCVQGEVKNLRFVAEGNIYEEKTIFDDSIDNSFFILTVNGNEWKCVDSLFLCDSTEQSYQIRTLPNFKGITIRFGNNVFGKKLNKDDIVEFKYITTLGSKGNIFSSDIINIVESQAFDANADSVKLYCKNTTMFVGGKDEPSIEEIRELSPKVYQTGDRASSREDYYTILKNINYLSKVSVWGAYETLKDKGKDPWGFIPTEENVIHLALLDSAYEEINDVQKNNIIEQLHSKCDPTDLISFEKTSKIPMIFDITATLLNSSYTTAEVESYIKSNLSSTYGIDVMNFGESIYNSDYIRLIDETKGIDNHHTEIYLYLKDKILTSAYYGSFNLPIFPIKYSSVRIEAKDTSQEDSDYELIATCDVNGNLVGEGIYVTTGSTLDLNSGAGAIYIDSGFTSPFESYEFKITYQYTKSDLINTSRSNILYYDDAKVTLNYK